VLRQRRRWWRPALVLAIDLVWSLILEMLGRPLFVGLFPGQAQDANRLLDIQLMPMLWISYGIVLSAQVGWLAWASRQRSRWSVNLSIGASLGQLRRAWWCCALGQLALSIGLQLSLAAQLGWGVDPAGLVFVLALLLCDLVVIFWLPTALLVPEELGSAIPLRGRVRASSGRRNHRQIQP